jgi:hypothetical protein
MSLTPVSWAVPLVDGVVTNAKLANMAESAIKGRVSSGAGVPEDLSAAQVLTVLGITAAGADLIDDATAADQRATMGVAYGTTGTTVCVGNDSRLSDPRTPTAHDQAWSTITATPTALAGYGITDAQPLDAELTAIAGLVSAANKIPYFTGSGTAVLADLSAFGRTLIAEASSAPARETLGVPGLGTGNTFSQQQVFSDGITVSGSARFIDGVYASGTSTSYDRTVLMGRAGGTSGYNNTITTLALSASRTWSLPDRSDTFAGLKSNTFTEAQIIGTDPGGSELLRVGGGAKVGWSLTAQRLIANDGYVGSVGDVSVSRGDGTGCIFFSATGTRYIYSDGNVFDFSGAPINATSYKVSNTKVVGGQASAIADVSTADATDLTSAIALANANKAKINTILAMLRTHGLIAT